MVGVVEGGTDDRLVLENDCCCCCCRFLIKDEVAGGEKLTGATETGRQGKCRDGLSTTSTTAVKGVSTVLSTESLPLKDPVLKFSKLPLSLRFLSPPPPVTVVNTEAVD